MYAILDIETTGGKYNEEGITEIAIYRFDGHQVIDNFSSLVNPEREIQPFVVKLTGINNKMLRNAPKFYEIAKRIVEITENCIIVAHNATFDYRILQTEFKRLGFDFFRNTLCTVELSQQLIPDKESYSLGKLVRSLGIPVNERHRAVGDASATLKLFKYLLEKDTQKSIITASVKNNLTQFSQRHIHMIDALPESLGVYYMHNKEGKIIYIGKHKNIKKRVNQHFTSSKKRDILLQKKTHSVTYEETGNELIAELKEGEENLLNKPKYNNKEINRNKSNVKYGLISFINEKGYRCFEVKPIEICDFFLTTFETIHQAQLFLYQITEEFQLCPKFQGLSQAKKNCHNYTIHKCNGACIEEETTEEYNARAESVLERYCLVNQSVAIIDKGRFTDEKSLVLVIDGQIKGYGFFNLNYQISQPEIIENLVTPIQHSLKNTHILHSYIRNKNVKIINIYKQKPFNNEN